jgi:hypothetical protein
MSKRPSVWALVGLAIAGFPARSLGQAIPLVPIEEDAGAPTAPSPAPSPGPTYEIRVLDAGPADRDLAPWAPASAPDAGGPLDAGAPAAIPLVPIAPAPVDAGAPAPVEVSPAPLPVESIDAGSALPDAGAGELPQAAEDAGPSSPAAPPADAGPAPVDAGPPPPPPEPENPNFVKGELSQFLGANRIAVQTTRVGLGLGVDRIDNVIYALLEPRLDLHLGDFGLGLAVPLNLELYNTHLDPNAPPGQVKLIGTQNLGHVRSEDYQSPHDYARVLQYLTYGKKEDHLYVDIGQIYAQTLGHGEILRRYQPNLDLGVVRIAGELDAYNDYVGTELMTNDLLRADLLSGLVFVKPLSFVSTDRIARSFSLGVSYAIDREAPDALSIKDFPGSGLNGCDCRPVEVPDGHGGFQLDATTRAVSLLGVDAEVKVLKTDIVDLKPYADFTHLLGGDSGLTLGLLGRFNFLGSPVTPTQAVRLVLEGRYLGDRYRPSYFDTFYEVDKYIFQNAPSGPGGAPVTQWQATQQGFGSRAGYYAEATYAVVNWVSATVAIEGDSAGPAKNLTVHAELPKLFVLQLFATYYKRGFTGVDTFTEFDKNSMAVAAARIELLPILYLNGRAYQTFQLDTSDTHTYVTTRGVEGDVELGWQF